jgi:hypothetical protein
MSYEQMVLKRIQLTRQGKFAFLPVIDLNENLATPNLASTQVVPFSGPANSTRKIRINKGGQ